MSSFREDGLVASDPLLPRADGPGPGTPLAIARIETFVFRYPLASPVVTSFGIMRDRPAVLVRVEDRDGAFGWGEVWCNFPSCGAEHRARLVESEIAPRLLAQSFDGPAAASRALEAELRVLTLQTGEWGSFAQCLAGIDIALWDLAARKQGVVLADLLAGGRAARSVPAYASGINRKDADSLVPAMREKGYGAFKVKIGLGVDGDVAVLASVADGLRAGEAMMADANQAWDLASALAFAERAAGLPLTRLEEPLAADRPVGEWARLAEAAYFPIAAGENLRGLEAFEAAAGCGAFAVLQPDLCKWGGFSGTLPVARAILAAGRRYCPHFLGAGLGLMASAHLLAAVGGDGMLEIDVNANPLRDRLAEPLPAVGADGTFALSDAPGLQVVPNLAETGTWLVAHSDSR